MVDEVSVPTGIVATAKVAAVAFCGMMMVAGTVASEGLLLLRTTVTPPPGAGPPRVTVAVEVLPPVTVAGTREREARPDATTRETVAVFETGPAMFS